MNQALELMKVWVIDESRLSKELIDAIATGRATIHDGVAYWAKGSGKSGIIAHLPFKETVFQSTEEAIKYAKATTTMTVAASTCIILGAIIIQTKYLSAKLDKIQAAVDDVAKEIHAQNIIYYLDKFTEYIGCVEFSRTLLSEQAVASEITDLASPLLVNLASKRNHALSFVGNILILARNTNHISIKHYELILNFTHMMLEVMPLGLHLEYMLACRIGKPQLAEKILLDGSDKYYKALDYYKSFLNEQHKLLVRGSIGEKAGVFHGIEGKAERLFKSEENKLLLSLPTGRVALLEVIQS